ncbi:MAG TPA: serine hydrolase [Thermoleophilaceae bacterium]|nr:serine hydrolase [Thermoleophilaceae bacterium]
MRLSRIATAAALTLLFAAAPATSAARTCPEPGEQWNRATPAHVGMDGEKLQDAIDYASTQASFAVRVYRAGCLVGEDRLADQNRHTRFQSWSLAKSVTSMIFGRAMTMGLMSADDPVGSLVPEADEAHGAVRVEDLLTMSSGLKWNGLRDYNIFTMPDRVRDALTLEPVKPPGTYFEYAQSPVSLLAEIVGRSAGEDVMAFAQRELMGPLGITPDDWDWNRDRAGHVGGFWGVRMKADDYGRFGELMRRGGVWRGRRLLSREYVRRAVEPSRTNGCYGWLIWVNAAQPCIGVTIQNRPVKNDRDYPDLPADFYTFSGLFGQRVTVFPSQELVIVRTGQDPGLVPAGQANWEHELYTRVLGSITDGTYEPPGEAPRVNNEREDVDYGFQTALSEPEQYEKGVQQDPLPPAGPARARAAIFRTKKATMRARRVVRVRLACPPAWPADGLAGCTGRAKLKGAKARRYAIRAGDVEAIRFRLARPVARKLRRKGMLVRVVRARNADAARGTASRTAVRLLP